MELLAVSSVEESCELPVAKGLDGKTGTPSLHTSAKSTGQERTKAGRRGWRASLHLVPACLGRLKAGFHVGDGI